MSQYHILAADYDGTLATDGVVNSATLDALSQWKSTGRQLILITGRQFDDLLNTVANIDLFDLVIPENGAMLYHPQQKRETLLASPPPEEFVQMLRDRILRHENTPTPMEQGGQQRGDRSSERISTGRVIVSTWVPHDTITRDLIQELNLDLQIIMNKRAVMVLPTGTSKASGLHAALKELGVSPDQVVGVGDAENDADFLKLCGLSVAVENALPNLKEQVDWVTQNSRGEGVAELVDRLLREGGDEN